MKKIFFYSLLISTFLSCSKKEIVYPKLIPTIFDTIISSSYDSIQIARNIIYKVGFYGDTLNLNTTNEKKYLDESIYTNNSKWYDRETDSIVVFVDGKNDNFHTNFNQPYFDIFIPPPPSEPKYDTIIIQKNIEKARIRILKKLKTHYKALPIYIYNKSKQSQEIQKPISGGDLFMILEAKNNKGVWKPIEYFEQFGFLCGTGHQDYILKPNQFIIGSLKKYEGNFETTMRVKLRSYNKVFYSNEFTGKINYSQFYTSNIIKKIKNRFNYKGEERLNSMLKNMFLN